MPAFRPACSLFIARSARADDRTAIGPSPSPRARSRCDPARRPFRPCIAAALLLAVWMPAAPAQMPPPLANPNLRLAVNGSVSAIVRLADGSVVFGGRFSSVNDVPRANLAKLKPDGALDPDWDPAPDREVYALAADAAGHVYVGGWFYAIGGQERQNLAKLSADGTGAADAEWNPSPSSFVYALALDDAGNVYAGGQFDSIGTENRSRLARLEGAGIGAVDPSWNPSPDSTVHALAVDAAGDVYVGGQFALVGTQSAKYLARISSGGALDASWNPAANGTIRALALDGAGHVYAGGEFVQIGGRARRNIARLSAADGRSDAVWDPAADGVVRALAVDAAGDVLAGGLFSNIGARARRGAAKLSGSGAGAADTAWDPSATGGSVQALAVAGSRVYAGGSFFRIGGEYRLAFAALSDGGTGAAGAAIDAEQPSGASLLLRRPYGMLVGGPFLKANGALHPYALRLRTDGTIDTGASADDAILALIAASLEAPGPLTISGTLSAVAALPDGSFLFGGSFTSVGGVPRRYLAKLRPDGTLDPDWNPSADAAVRALVTDALGNVYAGGLFTTMGGQPRGRLARLSGTGTGTVDPSWAPAADDEVRALAVDAVGDVYAGGLFTNVAGQSRRGLAKLSGSGAVDGGWNPRPDRFVDALAVDDAGYVYLGGDFHTIGDERRDYLARVACGGGVVDGDWNPAPDDRVEALAIDGRGNLYAAGRFRRVGDRPRTGLAALPPRFVDAIFADGFERQQALSRSSCERFEVF